MKRHGAGFAEATYIDRAERLEARAAEFDDVAAKYEVRDRARCARRLAEFWRDEKEADR